MYSEIPIQNSRLFCFLACNVVLIISKLYNYVYSVTTGSYYIYIISKGIHYT